MYPFISSILRLRGTLFPLLKGADFYTPYPLRLIGMGFVAPIGAGTQPFSPADVLL